jgi:hypothetical protein
MIVERVSNQIVIKVSKDIDAFGFQRIMDYLEYSDLQDYRRLRCEGFVNKL